MPALLLNDPCDRVVWAYFYPRKTLLSTFEVFSPRGVVKLMTQPLSVQRRNYIFQCLLTSSDWQSTIGTLEREMRRLQSQAIESLEKEALVAMGTFRRKLAAARESIADDSMLAASRLATTRRVSREVRGLP